MKSQKGCATVKSTQLFFAFPASNEQTDFVVPLEKEK